MDSQEISAKHVKIGDELIRNHWDSKQIFVDKIEVEQIGGKYISVYTQDGTILVNSIGVSSYSVDNVEAQKLLIKTVDALISKAEAEMGYKMEEADLERILKSSVDFWKCENPEASKKMVEKVLRLFGVNIGIF